MRNYQIELEKRVEYIKNLVKTAGVSGIVFGNSGGKDSALVGILCKMACEDTIGVLLPCGINRNFETDLADGQDVAKMFNIKNRLIDLTEVKNQMMSLVSTVATLNDNATTNIAPRLRMTALYAIAAAENRLVAGTGNRSEMYVGYFTKWGDGGHDFNPISDLTATEVLAFLTFLKAPKSIVEKAPSAGLKEGQTDEKEMGVTYEALDNFIVTGEGSKEDIERISHLHKVSNHKRKGIDRYAYLEEQK